jgi:GT2 family glycosyltransferase
MEKNAFEKVSVVIPTLNRKEELRKCLNSVFRQDYPHLEVVVVDNGSTDGTQEMIGSEFPDVRSFRFERNLYACKARNFGVAKSSGAYVWFLDSDAVIQREDCLSTMLSLIRSDDTIGSIGGTAYCFEDGSTKIVLPQRNRFDMFSDWDQESFQLVGCDFLPSSNLLMKREVLLKIGGFVEIYGYLLEDNDLGIRILKRGLKNITDRRTVAFHPYRPPLNTFKKAYRFYKNSFLYIFLNYQWKNWASIIADQLRRNGNRSKNGSGRTNELQPQRLAEKLKICLGFLSGLIVAFLFLFIPVCLWMKYRNINYVARYMGENG